MLEHAETNPISDDELRDRLDELGGKVSSEAAAGAVERAEQDTAQPYPSLSRACMKTLGHHPGFSER